MTSSNLPLTVTLPPLPAEVEQTVRDWFAGRREDFTPNGDRSVLINRPAGGYAMTKIKGAGQQAGKIHFGQHLDRGPPNPVFDYDGRFMDDVATGHNGAYVGGMSMQQAVTEWRMTGLMQRLGHSVPPCLGYGSVTDGRHRSWFAVLAHDPGWRNSLIPPDGTTEHTRNAARLAATMMLKLARDHDHAGFLWVNRDENENPLYKDLHPFRRMDPMNQSQLSWVMHVYFALHIQSFSMRVLAPRYHGAELADIAPMWIINSFCPKASFDDWNTLRHTLVAEYMVKPKADFSPETLQNILESSPITACLLDMTPPDYSRLR